MKAVYSAVAAGVMLAASQLATAGSNIYFNPLTQSSAVASPNHVNELNSPWQTPAGVAQWNLTSLSEVEADYTQSIVRVDEAGTGGRPTSASMFDMVAFDDKAKYIFIPHETLTGAGVSRYNIAADRTETLFSGDGRGLEGDWSNDYGAFDPSTWTPNKTLLLAEEWSGQGRVIEVLNPKAPVEEIEIRELEAIANVSHEGLRFSHDGQTLYFVDEDRSGSIYKFVMDRKGDYTSGQTFVLSVDAFDGVASDRYSDDSNVDATRTGWASWVPVTDADGNALTEVDPFSNEMIDGKRAGRVAADELNGTPYGRPEDMEIGRLRNGNEVMYFTATSEAAVYSVEMVSDDEAIVRVFASEVATPKNLGFPATTGVINSPDNLAQDALGNIYIIEDAPNGGDVGGDIWFVRDTDGDGVAESVDHFMSIQVDGAEATGMIFNPRKPTQFVVAVQHPDSTNIVEVEGGMGDALWMFDLKKVVPPTCKGKGRGKRKGTCSSAKDYTFIKDLKRANKQRRAEERWNSRRWGW
jgi:hypothetical protein